MPLSPGNECSCICHDIPGMEHTMSVCCHEPYKLRHARPAGPLVPDETPPNPLEELLRRKIRMSVATALFAHFGEDEIQAEEVEKIVQEAIRIFMQEDA